MEAFSCTVEESEDQRSLGLPKLISLFSLSAIGCCLGIATFVLEVLWRKINSQRRGGSGDSRGSDVPLNLIHASTKR